jgi:hypothetical protein
MEVLLGGQKQEADSVLERAARKLHRTPRKTYVNFLPVNMNWVHETE